MTPHNHERRDDNVTSDEMKTAMKRALKEWLDDKFAEFGWFSFKAVTAAALAALVFFILTMNGWHKGP